MTMLETLPEGANPKDYRRVVRQALWDTADGNRFDEYGGQTLFGVTNCGKPHFNNIQVPGQLPADDIMQIDRVLVGAPGAILKDWQNVQWTLTVGSMPRLVQPMWMTPDAVELKSELPANVGYIQNMHTPLDWTFLVWHVKPCIVIAPRQAFDARLETPSPAMPPMGRVRFVLDGLLVGDVY